MYKLIKDCREFEQGKVVPMGDFNFPHINWDKFEAKDRNSIKFVEAITDLIQNVTECIGARGEDTPHLLDLILSNDKIIEETVYMSSLGKSDHCVSAFNCVMQRRSKDLSARPNYEKGDYIKFWEYLKKQDWESIRNDDLEGMWDVFEKIILKGTDLFIPKVNKFGSFKKTDIRKYFFTNRVVDIWNSLPDYVVEVNSTNIFKQRSDKF